MQGTAELHHEIADALFPQTDAVFHDAAALDTAIDVLDPEPPLVERLVGQVLLVVLKKLADATPLKSLGFAVYSLK